MQLVLITGLSGSGKSVALHALEDAGFYCVDNLPPELLLPLLEVEREMQAKRVAVAMDVRSARSLPTLPHLVRQLWAQGQTLSVLFLDTSTETLVRRFSETRRLHPLTPAANSDQRRALVDAIELERELLSELRDLALVLDTSTLKAAQLRNAVKEHLGCGPSTLTLVFESFGFKRGVPLDADYVFDVRMLPNPHYEPELRALTGRDAAVADYLRAEPEVAEMQRQIEAFLRHWLPRLRADQRSYVTVAVGCTGGQHRSVFLVEQLALALADQGSVRVRHRELESGHLAA